MSTIWMLQLKSVSSTADFMDCRNCSSRRLNFDASEIRTLVDDETGGVYGSQKMEIWILILRGELMMKQKHAVMEESASRNEKNMQTSCRP